MLLISYVVVIVVRLLFMFNLKTRTLSISMIEAFYLP